MVKTTTDLKDIVRLGGGISVDAITKTTTDLKDIARLASDLVPQLFLEMQLAKPQLI